MSAISAFLLIAFVLLIAVCCIALESLGKPTGGYLPSQKPEASSAVPKPSNK